MPAHHPSILPLKLCSVNKLNTPSLENKNSCWLCPSPFVNIFASCRSVQMFSLNHPFLFFPPNKMAVDFYMFCSFVINWIGCICRAALLSQNNLIGNFNFKSSSLNNPTNHTTSATALGMLLYSASTELLDIVFWFFDFQEIKESPTFTTKPLTGFLVIGQVS